MIRRALGEVERRPVSHDPRISKRVLLEAGEVLGLANFSQAVFAPGDRVAGHSHQGMWEVFFVREGRGRIRVEGVESPMIPDECWVVEPGEMHELWNDGSRDLVLLYFGLSPEIGGEP